MSDGLDGFKKRDGCDVVQPPLLISKTCIGGSKVQISPPCEWLAEDAASWWKKRDYRPGKSALATGVRNGHSEIVEHQPMGLKVLTRLPCRSPRISVFFSSGVAQLFRIPSQACAMRSSEI